MATDARLKLVRASEHILVVTDMVDAWLQGDDFSIDQVQGADGRTEVRVRFTAAPPPEIGLIVGEAVHSLGSALDNAVYASARADADESAVVSRRR